MKSDVCLILEGTWPYVAGGVSTWVAQIFDYMPHLKFSVLYIGSDPSDTHKLKYKIPGNVVEIQKVFLHGHNDIDIKAQKTTPSQSAWASLDRVETAFSNGEIASLDDVEAFLSEVSSCESLMYLLQQDYNAWQNVVKRYEKQSPADTSFLHYFWTHRFINIPTMQLLYAKMPKARVYHSACTGYAGLLGAIASHRTGSPLLISEHGLYARERRIEIFNAEWVFEARDIPHMDKHDAQSYFKAWWIRFFLSLSRTAYNSASQIIALFDANRIAQCADGAKKERTSIIPNGIDLSLYSEITTRKRSVDETFRIGFVGRITEIKDIKTLLRSLAILRASNIDFIADLMGPLDEEPEYVLSVQALTHSLGLSDIVEYTGRVSIRERYPKYDVIVLTSISEGQPFIILEAHGCGVPIVSTDVGSCRELLNGRTLEDKELGQSGLITPVATPSATASALERLARNPELARKMGTIGYERVRKFYDIRKVMREYSKMYEENMYASNMHAPVKVEGG